jgi:hypothetical protein
MRLSEQAKKELKEILLKEHYDPAFIESLTDEEINSIGDFVLTVMVTSLKVKNRIGWKR